MKTGLLKNGEQLIPAGAGHKKSIGPMVFLLLFFLYPKDLSVLKLAVSSFDMFSMSGLTECGKPEIALKQDKGRVASCYSITDPSRENFYLKVARKMRENRVENYKEAMTLSPERNLKFINTTRGNFQTAFDLNAILWAVLAVLLGILTTVLLKKGKTGSQ